MKKLTVLGLMIALVALPLVVDAQTIATQAECLPFVGTVNGTVLDGHGYARYAPVAVTRLSDAPAAGSVIHPWASGAVLWVSGAAIRYRTDGVNPTASEGALVPAGSAITFVNRPGELNQLRFIQTGGTAEVDVIYCWQK